MENANYLSHEVSRRMESVRQKETRCEIDLRKALDSQWLRYRLQVQLLIKPRRVADAVFVDGCFWHGCPEHASRLKSNTKYWRDRIETNRFRDADTDRRLGELGWQVVRIWEHEKANEAKRRIAEPILSTKKIGIGVCR